jgi:hypothetical protein
LFLFFTVLCYFFWKMRSGTNKTHISADDIDDLGEFID